MSNGRLSQLSYVVPLLACLSLYLYNRASSPPPLAVMSPGSPWADTPFALVPTPRARLNGKEETKASQLATMMAVVHNQLIRGLNSIYHQAEFVPEADADNFVTFCECWSQSVHSHHDNEEKVEFPLIEELSGDKGIMERNVVEHSEFLPGLLEYEAYLAGIRKGESKFHGKELIAIIDKFGQKLRDHLMGEIETLEALDKYDFDWQKYNDVAHKHAKQVADRIREIPFSMTNHDVSFEGGIHPPFPPFPGFVRKLFQWWYIPTLKGAWEFSACDSNGNPQPLKYTGK